MIRLSLIPAVLLAALPGGGGQDPRTVEFNRDVRPILADRCFQCHGPDAKKRQADLRLDTEEGARADRDGTRAVVPGDPARSELLRRVTSDDPEERMPPAKTGRKLSEKETGLLRRWIEEGARWQKHWAFLPPRAPPVPEVRRKEWVRNPVDAFVLERLEREGLPPSPEAEKTTLLRRASLDLTGLPPTPEEADAFLADGSPGAFEKVVDRLLASPRYGERMARPWLDAARYADTNGYQTDGERVMWRWRDWVIEAFNANLTYDRFTVEQIAGDMLPGATLDQKIATGFNRNHRGNSEGGIIPEEYAVEYVVDRVDTTATVWLGLTLGCARCHDHKFDPIAQKEFYRLFAYFNNVPEKGRAIKFGNSVPVLLSPTRDQERERADLERRLAASQRRFAGLALEIAAAQEAWEKGAPAADGMPAGELAAHLPLADPAFDGKRAVDAGDKGAFGFFDKFSISAWVQGEGPVLSRMADVEEGEGYALVLAAGRVQFNLVKRWLDDALRVETERLLAPGRHHVLVTYDGSRVASGVRVYVAGREAKLKVTLDELNQSFATKEPLRIGAGGGRFRGSIEEVRVYARALSAEEAAILATPEPIRTIAAVPPVRRSLGQALKVRAFFLENGAPEKIGRAHRELLALRKERERLIESLPTTMVMEEMAKPRPASLLLRGQYDKPGEKVEPGVPAVLSEAQPATRLELARWLVAPSNPLTARVAVNRTWQMLFGSGLVRTTEDFGTQGDWPSHPDLLYCLAAEFMTPSTRSPWDLKRLLKLVVTSATYRQSSRVTPALLQRDPDNRLLARGPRFRLPADMVRDQALAASGLLVEKLGGPSVRPYQPAGLLKELSGAEDYRQDRGEGLYRRSLYTFWKRAVPPPAMTTFDAAGREACVVRESRTNTPLQALNLMNDVTYVEAARALAERVMARGGPPEERIALAFRLVTARRPAPAELRVLADAHRHYLALYGKDPEAARKLLSVGERPRDPKLDPAELAALATVAGLILNLDETVTKE